MDVENQESTTFKYAISHNAPININSPKMKTKKTPYVHILTKYQDNAISLFMSS